VTTDTPTRPLASERIFETHWTHFGIALAGWSLVPAAVLAPGLQWLMGPEFAGTRGLLTSFQVLAMLFGVVALTALCMWSSEYLRRTTYRITVFERGVELRDGQGAVLGETAAGTLRVANINMQLGRQMIGALHLQHAGGRLALVSRPYLAPWPGRPAEAYVGWHALDHAKYELVQRFAA
jgi:hypothetical protein